ncbi:MAG TPA: VOC family protein [Chitinophagaceae bacterium]|nr:VOC family protein [Chitinophagaceae bacterium]
MQNNETDGAPSHVEPILAVKDIKETIEYWHDTLGFPNKWTWGEPPNYGGVNWNSTSVQFNLDPELASASKGSAIFIKVKKLEELYQYHQQKNAVIVEPLENKPWGMAGYTVKEINGYYIVFAGAMIRGKKANCHCIAFAS